MQEEITQKTLALCVETGKMTAQLLQQAMKKVLADMEKHKKNPQLHHGKQTLRQLMNALSTKNTGKYLEIVMRLYSSCKIPANEEQAGKLVVPSAFVNMFNNPALFEEYGYAFLLGLKGCNSNSKKQDNKND